MKLDVVSRNRHQSKAFATKQEYVAAFRSWNDDDTSTAPPTATHLLGLFYVRYKEKYRLLPPSDVREDFQNMQRFITEFMSEDPSLAPYVVEYFFSTPAFQGIQSSTFCNRNILSKWSAFERAEKLRSCVGIGGEQAEFRSDARAYGVVRV